MREYAGGPGTGACWARGGVILKGCGARRRVGAAGADVGTGRTLGGSEGGACVRVCGTADPSAGCAARSERCEW
eukprot:scaffold73021_cov61-Phaeocystis_antarctica.AAC.4